MFRSKHSWTVQPGRAAAIRERLGAAALFAAVPDGALARLAGASQLLRVDPGTALVREGRLPTHLYVITAGVFDVFSRGESSVETKVASLQEGDHFGEIGIIEGMPSTASVRAAGEAAVIRVPAREFLDVVREVPDLARTLRATAARKLAQTHPSYDPAATEIVLGQAGDLLGEPTPIRLLDELLRSITATAMNLFRAAACSIALVDHENGDLVFRSATGEGAFEVIGARIKAGEGIAGAVLESRAPVVVRDVARDQRFADAFASATGFKPTMIVARPLEVRGRVAGVIEVLDPAELDDRTTSLLALFSSQAALAIETGQALHALVDALGGWSVMSSAEKREAMARIRDLLGA